jgi:hypothetical protein
VLNSLISKCDYRLFAVLRCLCNHTEIIKLDRYEYFLVAKFVTIREIVVMNILKQATAFALVTTIISCQTAQKETAIKKMNNIQSLSGGQWEAKAMIKSYDTGDASVVSLDVIARKPQHMRMEVTTSMGIALASIAMKESDIEYILPKQKKYFFGLVTERSMYSALNVKVDPRILSAAFFETSYPKWECQADNGLLMTCKTPEGVELKWERSEGISKRISIVGKKFEVQVQIKKFLEKTEFPDELWNLKVPSDFKHLKL